MAENFGQRMNRLKRAKRQQIADEHKTDAVVDDASVFSPEGEVIRPMAGRVVRDGLVYCPAGPHYTPPDEMRGAICYWHKRHPKEPPLGNVMELPPARPDGWA